MEAVCGSSRTPENAILCDILRRVSVRTILRPRVGGRARSHLGRFGLLVIVLGLAFRVWALAGSWFYFDDLAFLSAGTNDPLSWHFVGRVYAGHVMPAGWLVVKGLATWAPYQWPVWAGVLLALQALASWGMLRLLRSMFGETRAVLVLLTAYVFYIFTVPAGVWFAAGINQLPLQVGLAFGLHAHLDYLRTRRTRSLVVTLLWTLASLAFYEKSMILFGLYALLALGWFSRGRLGERVAWLWEHYRRGVIAHGVVAVAYLVVYTQVGLQFGSQQPSGNLLSSVAYRLVGVAFSTGTLGGPFEWRAVSANALADPSDLISLGSWVALGSLIWYAASTRTLSRRAWSLIAFTLAANVYLLASARANLVGADIGLEYRYQTESAAVFVLSVGLAFLPLVGAVEVNGLREGVDRPYEKARTIRLVTVAVVIASMVSTLSYVRNWQDNNITKSFFDNVKTSAAHVPESPVPLVDLPLPQNLIWAFGYPENTDSHIFRTLDGRLGYPDQSVDALYVLDDVGRVTPAQIPPTRTMVGGTGCGYVLHRPPTRIPLNGPVIGGGWWIRMAYGAPRAFKARIGLDDRTFTMLLPEGAHTAYFKADGPFSSVDIENDLDGRGTCVTSLALGAPSAQPVP
jgi:hypothetical protein